MSIAICAGVASEGVGGHPHTPMKNAASPPTRAMRRASGDAGYGGIAQEHGWPAFTVAARGASA